LYITKKGFVVRESINTTSSLQPKLLTILKTFYIQPSYNYIVFFPETFHYSFLSCQVSFKLSFSEKPMRFSHICHSCNMFSPYDQIWFQLLIPQSPKLSSALCFESLQSIFFDSTVTDGTSTDILQTIMRTLTKRWSWCWLECLNTDWL